MSCFRLSSLACPPSPVLLVVVAMAACAPKSATPQAPTASASASTEPARTTYLSRLHEAVALEAAGHLDEARALYVAELDANPNDADTAVRLGNLESMRGDYGAALSALERAHALGATQPELSEAIADLYYLAGNHRDAVVWYDRAAPGQADSTRILVRRGRAHAETDSLDLAEADCERVLSLSNLSTERLEARELLGLIALRRGDIATAVRRLRLAIRSGSQQPAVYRFLAEYEFQSGRPEAALALTVGSDALVSEPALLRWRIFSLHELGRTDEAKQVLSEAHLKHPNAPELSDVAEILERPLRSKAPIP